MPDGVEVARDVTVGPGGSAVTVEELCEDIMEVPLFERLGCRRCGGDHAANERKPARRRRRTQ